MSHDICNLFNKIEKCGKNIRVGLGKLEYGSQFCHITCNKFLTNLLSFWCLFSQRHLAHWRVVVIKLDDCGRILSDTKI